MQASFHDSNEWSKVCHDEALHRKCRRIKCYETLEAASPFRLMFIIETDEPDVLRVLSDDLGNKWDLSTYPLHEMHEIPEEDHTVIAG